MSTPVDEKENPIYDPPAGSSHSIPQHVVAPGVQLHMPPHLTERSSDEDGTVVGEGSFRNDDSPARARANANRLQLHLNTEGRAAGDNESVAQSELKSPSQNREEAHRLDDDLRMLQVERQVSAAVEDAAQRERDPSNVRSITRERSRAIEPIDDFDVATNPLHERTQVYKPPEHPENGFAKFFKKIHQSSVLVRWVIYITPPTLIILIPLLIGAIVYPVDSARQYQPNVGGVQLYWFCIWLEIVWLSLWAGRLISKLLPWPFGLIVSLFTNNSKKWRDMAKQLEFPATIFFWMLAVEISFLPVMTKHPAPNTSESERNYWTTNMNKVIISFFVLAILNFIAKIIIQLIAISFHLRTYQDRIEINKFQIGSLTKLYAFSRQKIAMEDSDFEVPSGTVPSSGQRTPGQYLEKAQKNTKEAFNKFGDVAGRVAGDFTGKAVRNSAHPAQVVLTLLSTTGGSQVLARRLYRTFARDETETVFQEDLTNAFENKDEADAAFSMFDKDMNGDISMEELEAVCVEIGRERKSITASLKDLDSVVGKLDNVFMFIIAVVWILVLISLISTAASGVLTSAGSAVLALSWLFSATAQEFLQSIIFVFVKHPFDVGDRVTIYGNTGSTLKGDDYFVKEIALLYTEFKKMEGHVVQAPNSYLNTLFILNQRRSGGLAEAIPMIFKFGTTLEQIEGLRNKLLDFVKAEKREYQSNILTELREITEAHSITLNIIFFFKSNWQNELLRLQRRNKFICAVMVAMEELGIEGPRMRFPGQRESFPVYMSQMPHNIANSGYNGTPDHPFGIPRESNNENASIRSGDAPYERSSSIVRSRPRGESLAQTGRRMDFSLGMKNIAAGDIMGDVYDDRKKTKLPQTVITSPSPGPSSSGGRQRSATVGRSTSRSSAFAPGNIIRRGTDPRASGSLHRNRFFGNKASQDTDRMESGMAGIPEDPSGSGEAAPSRIDPRSGMISPAAMRLSTDDSVRPVVSGGGPAATTATTTTTTGTGTSSTQAAQRMRGFSGAGAHLGDNLPHLPDVSRQHVDKTQ